MAYPDKYKYTKEHEWIQAQGTTALVGITDFAQSQLGDIVFLRLPEVGARIKKEDIFGVVESVKSLSDLYAPASGEVVAANTDLMESLETINQNAHSAWMVKLQLSDPKELDSLMTATEYEAYIAEEQAK